MKWNPRYVAYAAAHGKTPAEMHESEEGGFSEFGLWIRARWAEFAARETRGRALCMEDYERTVGMSTAHRRFNNWLAETYPAIEEEAA